MRSTVYFANLKPEEVQLSNPVLVGHLCTLAQLELLPHLSATDQQISSAESWQDRDKMDQVLRHPRNSLLNNTKCHNLLQDFSKVHLLPRRLSNQATPSLQ